MRSRLVALKLDADVARVLASMPNKSRFIREAVEAHLGNACPLCGGSGLRTSSRAARLVDEHPPVRCAGCGAMSLLPCREGSGTFWCPTCKRRKGGS